MLRKTKTVQPRANRELAFLVPAPPNRPGCTHGSLVHKIPRCHLEAEPVASLSRKQEAWPSSCVLSGVANTVKQAQPEAHTNKKHFIYNFQVHLLTPPQLSRAHSSVSSAVPWALQCLSSITSTSSKPQVHRAKIHILLSSNSVFSTGSKDIFLTKFYKLIHFV